jgi:outer membrane protein
MFARRPLFLLLVLLSPNALAQGGFFGFTEDYSTGADVGERDGEARWRFALGGGIGAGPNFQGSDKYRLRAVPFAFAGYGRFFVGFGGAGVQIYRDGTWGLGALVSYGQGRKENVDQRLAGLGDVDRTVNAGVYAVARTGSFATRAVVYTDVGGEGHGTLARLDVLARFRVDERVGFFAGPGLTWGSRQYAQTFFGVTEEQAARTAFPEYHPGSGVNNVRLTGGANYRFAPNWRLIGSVSASRLSGDVGNSPIIETRAQVLAFISAIYLFR